MLEKELHILEFLCLYVGPVYSTSELVTDMPPGTTVQCEYNLEQQHWQSRVCGGTVE